MARDLRTLTMLGVLVGFAVGVLVGATMLGTNDVSEAQKNVVHAAPPVDPTIRAVARCFNPTTGDVATQVGDFFVVSKGVVTTAFADCFIPGYVATGGGYLIEQDNGKVRVTFSGSLADTTWDVRATR